MPVEQGPFEQIVNVQWEEQGGAVFVAGGYAEFVLYASIDSKDELSPEAVKQRKKDKKELFEDLGNLGAFTIHGDATSWDAANIPAGSYKQLPGISGKPTFVLGGNYALIDPATLGSGSGSIIMVSHDGKKWTKAFEKQWPDNPTNESGVQAFAWDKDEFYGHATSTEYYLAPTIGGGQIKERKIWDRLLTSSNGESFAEGGEYLRFNSYDYYPHVGPEPPNLTPPPLFMPHINPIANLPDGHFGYSETRDDEGKIVRSFLATPTKFDKEWYFHELPIWSEFGNSIDITIQEQGKDVTKSTKVTPVDYVTCVAYASEILMVGGAAGTGPKARIAASIDDGETWETVFDGSDVLHLHINTITAAPLSEIQPENETA
jgi:hypothetical protein